MLADLKADPEKYHTEQLEKQATLLSSMLKGLDITAIISLADTEPTSSKYLEKQRIKSVTGLTQPSTEYRIL